MENTKEYKVLARKYRPRKFKDLVGQDMLIQILSNAINNDRLAHAYLLSGVRGIGKTTTARLIAMSINCKDRAPNSCEPCDKCESCISTGVDSNLDVIEMDAASHTGVDDIREIIENVKYKPVLGRYKIFIIDEVHMLSKSAFNALLKTLEEPPEHVKFIFATTEVKKIPITVLSRCQRFDLHRIEDKVLSEHLMNITKLENIEIDNDAVSLIVRVSDGSIRDSLSLLDQAMTIKNHKIEYNSIINMLGLADRKKIFDLLEKIFTGKPIDALDQYKQLYDYGVDVNMIFDEMLHVIHFLTKLKIAPKLSQDTYIPEYEREIGSSLISKLSLNSLNTIWQILLKGFQDLQNSNHLFQHGEMIILQIIHMYDGPQPDDLIKKIKESYDSDEKIEKKLVPESGMDEKNKVLNFDNDKEKDTNLNNTIRVSTFRNFVDMFYKNREGLIHTHLYNNVSLISFSEGKVVINNERITDKSFNRNVAKLISKWTGRIWQVESSTSNLGKSLYEEDIVIQQKNIEMMKQNSEVKKILNEFPDSKIHSITDLAEANDKDDIKNIKIKKE